LKNIGLVFFIALLSYLFFQSKNILDISASVAIFLFGMIFLEEGFRAFAGGILEKFLKVATNTLPKSIAFGVITTAIVQSSSLVSVISISFLSAGFISLYQGIGIIFGSNLGTTASGWLVTAFGLKVNIAAYAMPMIVFGVIFVFQSNKKLKGLGQILAGLGFLFLGIAYMKDGFEAFRENIDLLAYSVDGYKGLFLFVAIGIFGTVIMQSSSAMFVLIITALAASQVTYANAIALAIGSNIGTTITAVLGSLSSDVNGKRLAVAHMIFNLVTGVIAIIFVYQFIFFVDFSSEFLGIGKEDYTYKLTLFHTYFNLFGIIIMLPFVPKLVKVLDLLIKKKAAKKYEVDNVIFLNNAALDFADTATKVLYKETKHLYNNSFEIIAKGLSIYKEDINSGMEIDDIIKLRNKPIPVDMEEFYTLKIKEIYGQIMNFAIIAQGKFEHEANAQIINIKNATISIVEAVKSAKHMQKNMLKYLDSDNEYIKEQYNIIRKNLTKQLRQAQMVFNTNEEDVALLLINKMELEAHQYDIATNKSLDNLIRNNQITYTMATSLMNDSTYASSIATHILKAVKALYITQENKHHDEILLSNDEIKETLHSTNKE
jgi:phosphate:Na+ symporter